MAGGAVTVSGEGRWRWWWFAYATIRTSGRRATAGRPKLPCKLSKLALPKKKKTLLSVSRLSSLFFPLYFSRLFLSLVPAPSPRDTRLTPHPTRRAVLTHTRTIFFGNTRRPPNTAPEWRCDGMFEFRYAAFQCENFSLSHSAAFAARRHRWKRDRRIRRFCRRHHWLTTIRFGSRVYQLSRDLYGHRKDIQKSKLFFSNCEKILIIEYYNIATFL